MTDQTVTVVQSLLFSLAAVGCCFFLHRMWSAWVDVQRLKTIEQRNLRDAQAQWSEVFTTAAELKDQGKSHAVRLTALQNGLDEVFLKLQLIKEHRSDKEREVGDVIHEIGQSMNTVKRAIEVMEASFRGRLDAQDQKISEAHAAISAGRPRGLGGMRMG